MNNTLKMTQEALEALDFADLCIGAAHANTEIPKPRLEIARMEMLKAQKNLDIVRTKIARILLNEGGLSTEVKE